MWRLLRSSTLETRPAAFALIIGLICPWPVPSRAADGFPWEIRRIEGRDHVTTDRIAEFYQLDKHPGRWAYSAGKKSLGFRPGSREVEINGLKHWLGFPAVEHDGGLWVSRIDLSKTIEPSLRPAMVRGLAVPATVVLDPGHGGRDKGAIGTYQYEKNFALDLARRVRDRLVKAGVKVALTRNADEFVELHDRAAFANRIPRSIFVSIHFNTGTNRAANGFEIFSITPRGAPSTEAEDMSLRDLVKEPGNAHDEVSFLLAKSIYHAMHGRLQMADRGMKRARFAVLRLTASPSVLVEGGFLINPQDARRIASPKWRDTLAGAIADGILAYIALAAKGEPPPLAADYRSGLARPPAPPLPQPPSASPSPSPPAVQLRPLG